MFETGETYKDTIIELLKEEERSISSLWKALAERRIKVHKLFVTGYLRALEELNVLRSKEIPPAKVYMLSTSRERDIYETIGELAREQGSNPQEASLICCLALSRIFRRPVFRFELVRAGLDDEGLTGRVTGEERAEVKLALEQRGHRIPENNPAYWVSKPAQRIEGLMNDIILTALVQRFNAQRQVVDTKQTKLGDL
ncbi:MAG: hypothetical protein AB1665_05145 [Candidatus Thermoplasmatota archaeon]